MKSGYGKLSRNATISLIIVTTIVLDQITKLLAIEYLKGQAELSYLGGLFRLTYAENKGAFLSFGAWFPDAIRFHIFTLGVGIFLAFALRYVVRNDLNRLQTISMAFLIGGGVGNLIDRAFYGYVVDFLFMGWGMLRTGVFNIADMAILFAVIAFLTEGFFVKNAAKST